MCSLLPKDAEDTAFDFAGGALGELRSTLGATQLMTAGHQNTVHGPFATQQTNVLHGRDGTMIVVLHDVHRHWRIGCGGSGTLVRQHELECFGSEGTVFDVRDGQALLNEIPQQRHFRTPRHGQIQECAGRARLDRAALGAHERHGVRVDQPTQQVQIAAQDGTVHRKHGFAVNVRKGRAQIDIALESCVSIKDPMPAMTNRNLPSRAESRHLRSVPATDSSKRHSKANRTTCRRAPSRSCCWCTSWGPYECPNGSNRARKWRHHSSGSACSWSHSWHTADRSTKERVWVVRRHDKTCGPLFHSEKESARTFRWARVESSQSSCSSSTSDGRSTGADFVSRFAASRPNQTTGTGCCGAWHPREVRVPL